ncbi:MAG: hypothetical protein E4G95_05305, partial [Bacteroidia bacterium]
MKRVLFTLILISVLIQPALSQVVKKSLDHDAIEMWNRITEKTISPDGRFIAYKTEPWKGDTELFIYSLKGEKIASFSCGLGAGFSSDSRFLIFDILPATEVVRELRIKKAKKEEMPLKSSAIYDLKNGKLSSIERCKDIRVPAKWPGIIAWQPEADAGSKKESDKGSDLYLFNTLTGDTSIYPSVSFYSFAGESQSIIFVSAGKEESFEKGVYIYLPASGDLKRLSTGEADYKQVIISDDGGSAAFLSKMEETTGVGEFRLCYWNGSGEAVVVADNSAELMPEGWRISENGRLQFSSDNSRLFLGT